MNQSNDILELNNLSRAEEFNLLITIEVESKKINPDFWKTKFIAPNLKIKGELFGLELETFFLLEKYEFFKINWFL